MKTLRVIFAILLCSGTAQAFVFSCEEVQSKLLNTGIDLKANYACLIPSEKFQFIDAFNTIYLENSGLVITFAELMNSQCVERPNGRGWRATSSHGTSLTCNEEFTLIYTSHTPVINVVPFFINQTRTLSTEIENGEEQIFVAPDSGMSMRIRACTGVGSITVFTGAGKGESEERYLMKSWRCEDLPDGIIVFGIVITVSVDDNMRLNIDYDTNDFMDNYEPQSLERVAIMGSGRSDVLQNSFAVNIARFEASSKVIFATASCNPCSFDEGYFGSVTINAYDYNRELVSQEIFRSEGKGSFAFNQVLEVIYNNDISAPQRLWSVQDNFIVEVSFSDANAQTTAPTTPKPLNDKDPYCGCDLDPKFGMPVDWDPSEIWLDIAIILDTSEAMGEVALIDASTLIESFFGSDDSDVLITSTSATFYTRVGLIAMSDTAEVLYNLNMTKSDKVMDKVQIKNGVSVIDVVDSFKIAEQMLIEGQQSSPDRAKVRQVIYYMTDSDPLTDMTPMNQFKASNGIIIVNNFVEAGDTARPGLKDLASDGYYYTDIQDNYMLSIQLFCKANCYCKADKESYAGLNKDPALTAAGGCYHAAPVGVQFSQARSNCEKLGGGLIASAHDQEKSKFLQQSMAKAAPKSSYFWIGYSKSDDNVWRWEDKSTDSYTNWGEDEPSAAAVAKCTYADTTTEELYWGAGNCNVGFPSVCEFAPCSVGNNC